MKGIKRLPGLKPGLSGYILLAGAIIINIIVQGFGFFSMDNIGSIFSSNTPLILAALAQMIIMLSGGIDISIGNNMAFVNTIAIVLCNAAGWPVFPSFLVALAAGTIVGLLNGVIVACIRIPPLLATFASSSLLMGLSLLVLPKPGGTIPEAVYQTYGGNTLLLPTSVWIILAVVAIIALIAKFPVGRYIAAIGSNERNAYACGINVTRVKLFTYTMSGFVAAVAGLCLTALMAAGNARSGRPFALTSIAAVIIGGTLITGRWKSYIGGAVAGALFLPIVTNIVFYIFSNLSFDISTFYQQLLSNFIIILGLASAALTNRNKKHKPLTVRKEAYDERKK